MNNGLSVIGAVLLGVTLLLFSVIVGPLVGAFAGALFGFIFNDTATQFLAAVGLGNLEFWQFGAVVGFVGGFFKAVVQKKD